MITRDKILNYINKEYDSEKLKSVSWKIIDYIYNNQRLSHIEFGSLKNLVGEKYKDEDILYAIQILSFGKYPILDIGYEYIDKDNKIFYIPKKMVKEAEKHGNLVHPNTGRLIPQEEYKKNLYFYFIPIYSQNNE